MISWSKIQQNLLFFVYGKSWFIEQVNFAYEECVLVLLVRRLILKYSETFFPEKKKQQQQQQQAAFTYLYSGFLDQNL